MRYVSKEPDPPAGPAGRVLLGAVVLRGSGELLLMLARCEPGEAVRALRPFYGLGAGEEMLNAECKMQNGRLGGEGMPGSREGLEAVLSERPGAYGPAGCWGRVLAAAGAWAREAFGPDARVGADEVIYLGEMPGDAKAGKEFVPVWAVMLPVVLAEG